MAKNKDFLRIQKRLLDGRGDSLQDEALLRYVLELTDVDAPQLAQQLLQRFGSFNNVLEMQPSQLLSVEGMNENAVALLASMLECNRRYMMNRIRNDEIMMNLEDCGERLMPYFQGLRYECVYLMSLDARSNVICVREMGKGDVNSANVTVRKLVTTALETNAQSIVLAHNHPAGIALPSEEDVNSTILIRDAMQNVGIVLLDHIIVAGDDYVSMRQTGLLT